MWKDEAPDSLLMSEPGAAGSSLLTPSEDPDSVLVLLILESPTFTEVCSIPGVGGRNGQSC